MFRDAREVQDDAVFDCDVCIVGTGAAGVTVALGLRDAGYRVIVLEAGGTTADAETTALHDIESAGLRTAPSSRQRLFGGTTNSWWGKVGLLDDVDFAPREWVPNSGWPIERSELLPFYVQACALMGMPDLTRFEVPAAIARRGERLGLGSKTLFWTRRALNFGSLYRARMAAAKNVSTLLYANVTEVVLDSAGRVERLAVRTLNGRRFDVRPGVTILAGGGIENARLLLNSASSRPAGVGNDADQVGRYYMDHPRGVCGRIEASSAASALSPAYWSGKPFGSVRFRLGVSLSPEAQAAEGALNSYLNLSPVYGGGDGGGVEAIRNLYRKGPRALKDRATTRALVTGVPDVVRYFRFKRYGRGRVSGLNVENFMEQEPRASNRVTLSDRRDALGQRLARVELTLSERDMESVRVLHRSLDEELRRRGMGTLRSPVMSGEDEWPIANDAAHHMGSTRMGTDRRSSVVDPNCRVHGVDNLFVAGSSVFPTGGSANPTLTIVALAARLADRVRSGLQARPADVRGSTTHNHETTTSKGKGR